MIFNFSRYYSTTPGSLETKIAGTNEKKVMTGATILKKLAEKLVIAYSTGSR